MAISKRFFENKTIAILTGGGDTPALNASIEAIKSRASTLGFKVYGILQGWKGLLDGGTVVELTGQPYDGWYGGTALYSSRTNPFPTENNDIDRSQQVVKNLDRYKIDVLVSIGGDDTNGAAKKLYEKYGIPVIGFPKTIDNDLRTRTIHNCNGEETETVLCPGFPSAVNTVAGLTCKLQTTAESHQRIVVVEIMGRDAGWLTGAAKIGGAEICLIPEIEMTQERQKKFFEQVKKVYYKKNKKYAIVAVAEGTRWYDNEKEKLDVVKASTDIDEFGHPRLGGISSKVAAAITKNTGIDARTQNLGYLARSGSCSLYDKRFVNVLSDKVVDLILREDYGKMPVLKKLTDVRRIEEYNTSTIDMGQIENKSLDLKYYDLDEFSFNIKYAHFLYHMIKDPKGDFFKIKFPIVDPNKL